MARQPLNLGSAPNDGTGGGFRDEGVKIESNFTELYLSNLDNVITVNQVSDFGTIASDKVYFIKGFVDTGSTPVVVGDGVTLNVMGHNYLLSGLFSSEPNYTMFVGDANGVGNISFFRLDLKASGLNSQLFDLKSKDTFSVISFEQVNFSDCSKIGTFENFRQGEEYGSGRFGGTPQIEFIGNWRGGYLIERSLTRFLDDTSTEPLFKSGVGHLFNSRFDCNMNLDLGTNGTFIDFAPSNFSNSDFLQLKNMIVTRDGAFELDVTTVSPNIDEKGVKSKWTGNTGIPNTNKGGVATITTAVETVITTQNEWVDLAGTFTLTKEQHIDSPVNGQYRSIDENQADYNFLGSILIDGNAGDVIEARTVIFRDATSTFEEQEMFRTQITSNLGAADIGTIVMFDRFTLNENDYIKQEVRNTTSTSNFTAESGSSKFKLSGV